jgi:hypothetical protein
MNYNRNRHAICLICSLFFVVLGKLKVAQSAKYEFASSNTTRPTFTFDACFVLKLAPLADERSGFFIETLSQRLTRSSTY